MQNDESLEFLSVRDLVVDFGGKRRSSTAVRAIDNVTLDVARNESLGLAGESGSGKSTLGFTIAGRHKPSSGSVHFEGLNVGKASHRELRAMRRHVQMVFQDPTSTLNPRMRVGEIVAEPLVVHGLESSARARRDRARELLELCGMPADSVDRYPHMFSGGQRQRIGISRALASSPTLLIADEPTSALDVSVQAQIINLLSGLRSELSISILFVSHNLAVLRQACDRLAIMYRGRIVELGPTEAVFGNPLHPYTQSLLAALPGLDGEATWLEGRGVSPLRGEFGVDGTCDLGSDCPLLGGTAPTLREFEPGHHAECRHAAANSGLGVSEVVARVQAGRTG